MINQSLSSQVGDERDWRGPKVGQISSARQQLLLNGFISPTNIFILLANFDQIHFGFIFTILPFSINMRIKYKYIFVSDQIRCERLIHEIPKLNPHENN